MGINRPTQILDSMNHGQEIATSVQKKWHRGERRTRLLILAGGILTLQCINYWPFQIYSVSSFPTLKFSLFKTRGLIAYECENIAHHRRPGDVM